MPGRQFMSGHDARCRAAAIIIGGAGGLGHVRSGKCARSPLFARRAASDPHFEDVCCSGTFEFRLGMIGAFGYYREHTAGT